MEKLMDPTVIGMVLIAGVLLSVPVLGFAGMVLTFGIAALIAAGCRMMKNLDMANVDPLILAKVDTMAYVQIA